MRRKIAAVVLGLGLVFGTTQCAGLTGGHHHHGRHSHCLQNGGDVTNNTCSGFGF